MTAALAGATVGFGIVLIIAGFTTTTAADPTPPTARHSWFQLDRVDVAIGAIAAAAGAVMLVVTRWPVAALGVAALAGLAAAAVLRPAVTPRASQQRLDDLASWCEQLRDLLRAGALLTPAIATTGRTCGDDIRPAVTRLAARMEREHPTLALRRFADEINDPTGDLIASVLVTATTHAGNTAELLGELAALTRERVERRKSIEAERATTRLDMRIILSICAVTIAALMLFSSSSFLAPYRTGTGQAVLALVFAALIGAVVWARRLAAYSDTGRFLTVGADPR